MFLSEQRKEQARPVYLVKEVKRYLHSKIDSKNGHSDMVEFPDHSKFYYLKPKYYIERNTIVLKKKLRWCSGFDYCKLLLSSSSGSFVIKPHNPVKHFALSRRRSRVQIPAGALLYQEF